MQNDAGFDAGGMSVSLSSIARLIDGVLVSDNTAQFYGGGAIPRLCMLYRKFS
jgi:hypothetical protein